MQNQLFAASTEVAIVDGTIRYSPHWLTSEESQTLFESLRQNVAWEQSTIKLYGKTVKIPRLNAWYGDPGCRYEYSGRSFEPQPWLPELEKLRQNLEKNTTYRFNSVLVNCYRDGNDSVGWHSDDEPELGRNPVVASISLGAEREFQLRHRHNSDRDKCKLNLTDGSLLLMAGELQHYWHHQIPKTRRPVGERINLTFREIKHSL